MTGWVAAGAVIAGAAFGAGLWALAVFAFPQRPTLGDLLARTLDPPPPPRATHPEGRLARLGAPMVPLLTRAGLPGPRIVADLRITGTSVAEHLATKAILALTGLLTPALVEIVLGLAGFGFGVGLPLAGGLVLAVVGFLLPDLRVRSRAAELRDGFRHGLSAYLDLVWITLAGGSGIDGALNGAVRIGHGWAFDRLAGALSAAQLTRTTPWAAFHRLGEQIGVPELVELAGATSLAGTEGARVRTSLAGRAASLRAHQLTDAEARAQSATERMSLPVMALFLGFLTFIAFPAVVRILNGL